MNYVSEQNMKEILDGIAQKIGQDGGIETYQSGKSYNTGNCVIKEQILYQANTNTSTTWVVNEWDVIGTNFNTTSAYTQKTITNVVAPYEVLVQVGNTNYCKPPVNILKNVGGESGTTLELENYNNPSAYTIDGDFVEIADGKAILKNYKEYPITPQTIVVEKLSEFVEDGSLASEFIHVESEHSALSCAIGASSVGARAFTATS